MTDKGGSIAFVDGDRHSKYTDAGLKWTDSHG